MSEIEPRSSADCLVVLNRLVREHIGQAFHLRDKTLVNRRRLNDKELAAVRVRTCVRHAQCASEVVVVAAELVLERSAPDALAADTLAERVAALDHEIRDNAVEDNPVIVAVVRMGCEVFDRLGRGVGEENHFYVALVCLYRCNGVARCRLS